MASVKQQGLSARAMARALSRDPSTISRELERHILDGLSYGSHAAQAACVGRRVAARPVGKLDFSGVGCGAVRTILGWKWSPQQMAPTLERVFLHVPERHVSHETIYTTIDAEPRGELHKQLVACLRHVRRTRMPRSRGKDRRGLIPGMVGIHVKPSEVRDRVLPGHLEDDFIEDAGNNSSAGILVKRTSRLVLLAKMDYAAAASALAGLFCQAEFDRRAAVQELHLRPGT